VGGVALLVGVRALGPFREPFIRGEIAERALAPLVMAGGGEDEVAA
jgi:hypothetical protein